MNGVGRSRCVPIYDTRHFGGDAVEDLTRLHTSQRDFEPRTENVNSRKGQTTSTFYRAVRTTVLGRLKNPSHL
jgi:hypothetical protein